ncbi:relaxase MobL (plasmid) [Alicyclobacillus acidoterrestris]|uniref:relaxase MobL n=1 Tax=Alicyclobacillus acidoterrestris TaxID=1450 RepID=UPI003F532E55
MAQRSVVLVRYKKDIKSARNNVKYIGFRSRETLEEERGLFNRTIDHGADYQIFLNKIEKHPALQHENTVKMHTMILSMYESDYRALQDSGSNLKDLAREVMKDLEERKGMKLEWIGAVHENSGHPHVHLAIMSVGETEDGKSRRLYLDKAHDLPWLREKFLEKIQERVPDIERDRMKERDHQRPRERSRIRPVSRQMSHSLHSLSEHAQERMRSSMKDKRNRKRRSRRATSRIQQQRQGPTQSLDH